MVNSMDELIKVIQLPVLDEHWRTLKERWEAIASEADSLVCAPETIQAVKQYRADMRKEYESAEEQRKGVKAVIFAPWDKAEETYKECVQEPFRAADSTLKRKIDEFESEIKKQCEDELREYFAELCVAHHVEWLQFEQAGITVDMASAKQKSHKKLREQLVQFVARISSDIEAISRMDYAEEVLAEYKECLDFSLAYVTIEQRHSRIEAEREEMERRQEQQAIEEEAVRKVEALAPPKEQEPILTVSFTVTDTKARLIALREWMKGNGYKYE